VLSHRNFESIIEYDIDRRLSSKEVSCFRDEDINPMKQTISISKSKELSNAAKPKAKTIQEQLNQIEILKRNMKVPVPERHSTNGQKQLSNKRREIQQLDSKSTSVSKDSKTNDFTNMATALKKVSSNLNRISKTKEEFFDAKKNSNSSNYSKMNMTNKSGKSKSRDKSDQKIQNNLKTVPTEKSRAIEKIDPFKKKSYYNILKTASKAYIDKTIGKPDQKDKKPTARVSSRVMNLIRNEGASMSLKDSSSRENSNSVQRSTKEKSVKSKASTVDQNKASLSSRLKVRDFRSILSSKVPESLFASKSLTRKSKSKQDFEKEMTKMASQRKFVSRIQMNSDTNNSSMYKSASVRADSATNSKSNKEVLPKDTKSMLLSKLIKKMKLNEGDSHPTANQATDDLAKKAPKTAQDVETMEIDGPTEVKKEPAKKSIGSRKSIEKTIGKKISTPNYKSSHPSFKDFGSGVLGSKPVPLGAKKPWNDGKSKDGGVPRKGCETKESERERRPGSNKRGAGAGPNTNVFSNSYLITHVHQVNNYINKH
jgi:hypothetical protein